MVGHAECRRDGGDKDDFPISNVQIDMNRVPLFKMGSPGEVERILGGEGQMR